MSTGHVRLARITLFLVTCLYALQAAAAYSMAMGYTPKYPDDFEHFDYADPHALKGGDLVLEGYPTFDSLNPFLLKGVPASDIGTLVFETLLESSLDEPFSVYGLLANDFYLADDKLSATYHIDPRARFSNGEPVLAKDVKFSFDTLTSKDAHPQFRIYFSDVDSVDVLDRLTVRFNFKRVNPELHLVIGGVPVFSEAWLGGGSFTETSDREPISSGPYVVDEYQVGKLVRYRRNPDYWARDLPVRKGLYNFDTITFKYYKDRVIALKAFQAGEFDFFQENTSKRWARDHEGGRYATGELLKDELPHSNNAGMQGIVFNTRRDKFRDVRVRRAISLAFDFAWSNRYLFYDQYVQSDSYFTNSEMASRGLPEGDELALLEQYRDQLPESVFTQEWTPPDTTQPGALRRNLLEARDLLKEAGWTIQDGRLRNEAGEALDIHVMLVSPAFERILAPYAHNLKKLGIEMTYRVIDSSLYIKRAETFEFDMMVAWLQGSQSPGNELKAYYSSESADTRGSRNLFGVKDPVVDALIDKIISADDRRSMIIATRAMDRVLLHGEYLVPNWYTNVHRIAYRDIFGRPEQLPLYYKVDTYMMKTWWMR